MTQARSMVAKLIKDTLPNFEESASAYDTNERLIAADFTKASSLSGVEKPWSSVMPFVPINAFVKL